jgi:hypothetical protein
MAESTKVNKHITGDLAAQIGDLLDRGIHPGHPDFLPALDLKAGMGSHTGVTPKSEYGAFGRMTRNLIGYPQDEVSLGEAQDMAKALAGAMLLQRAKERQDASAQGLNLNPGFTPSQPSGVQSPFGAFGNPLPGEIHQPLGMDQGDVVSNVGGMDRAIGIQRPPMTMPIPVEPAKPASFLGNILNPQQEAVLASNDLTKITPHKAAMLKEIVPGLGQFMTTENDIVNPNTPLPASIQERKIEAAAKREEGKTQLTKLQDARDKMEARLVTNPNDELAARRFKEIQQQIDILNTSQKEGVNANRIAQVYGAKDFNSITDEPMTTADVARIQKLSEQTGAPYVAAVGLSKKVAADATLYQRQVAIAGASAGAAAASKQASTLVQPGVRSDLFDRAAFFKTGQLRNAPSGLTEAEAAKGNYIQISDKQRSDLAHAEQAGIQLDQIFGMADKLITAKNGPQAIIQGGKLSAGAAMRTNTTAKVYDDSLNALSNSLSKSLGGERGVLTNVDVIRWVNAMPKFTDTVAIKDAKSKLIKEIYQTSVDAQRRAIAGDDVTAAKTSLSKMLDRLQALDDQGTQQVIDHKLDTIVPRK